MAALTGWEGRPLLSGLARCVAKPSASRFFTVFKQAKDVPAYAGAGLLAAGLIPRPMKISERLPPFLARRLAGRATLQQVLDNSAWLFVDQLVRMAAGLLVGVWLARYLGPEQYGWLSYAAAVVGTVGAFTSLGVNAVVVREMVRSPEENKVWMGVAFFLKSLGAGLGFLICVGVAWLQPMSAPATRPLIIIVALGSLFQALDVIDLFFQSRSESRISAYVRIAACVAASLLKVGLILAHASLWALAVAGVVEIALCALGWVWTGERAGFKVRELQVKQEYVVKLLRESWPLALSGLAVYTQAYADQLVIGHMLGGGELGQYAVAMRLVTVFAFIPMLLSTVASPEITRARQDDRALYHRRLHDFYRLMALFFVATAVPLILLGGYGVRLLFGPAYAGAVGLLPWLALRLFFTNFGVARGIYLTNEGLFRFGLVTALFGAIANILLNVWWVPLWGARGAIAASLVSFAITTFALEVFQREARFNLRLMLTAAFLPWRRFAG